MRTKTPYVFPLDKIIRFFEHNPSASIEEMCRMVGVAPLTVKSYRDHDPKINARITEAMRKGEHS